MGQKGGAAPRVPLGVRPSAVATPPSRGMSDSVEAAEDAKKRNRVDPGRSMEKAALRCGDGTPPRIAIQSGEISGRPLDVALRTRRVKAQLGSRIQEARNRAFDRFNGAGTPLGDGKPCGETAAEEIRRESRARS